MTRAEIRNQKLNDELVFVNSIKGKVIDSKIKAEYRKTSFWRNFRAKLKEVRKVDYLTKRKLTKTWNCHHMRFDPRLYSDLDERYFRCFNNQIHDLLHTCINETLKDPLFMKRLTEEVELHIKLNNGKNIRDFK